MRISSLSSFEIKIGLIFKNYVQKRDLGKSANDVTRKIKHSSNKTIWNWNKGRNGEEKKRRKTTHHCWRMWRSLLPVHIERV